jgi:hypothetical protein
VGGSTPNRAVSQDPPLAMTSLAATALALPVRGLDRARLWWLRALGPLAKPLVRSRELRIAVFGSTSLLIALALTATVPLYLLAIGPLLLGIPHVGSDLRYLVFRPKLHRRWWLVVPAIGLYAAHSYTYDPRWGVGVTMLAITVARGRNHLRRLLALGLAGAWMAGTWIDARMSALIFAHLHNFAAVAFLWAWRPQRASKLHYVPLALFGLAAVFVLAGGLDAIVGALGGFGPIVGRTGIEWNLALYAPGVPAPFATRLVLLFAFAQSIHYAIWLRLIPEDDRPRETPRTWSATLVALRQDVGWPAALVIFAIAAGIAVWATVDLFAARLGYLRMVLFHGYMETAALALLFVEGRPLRSADDASASAAQSAPASSG